MYRKRTTADSSDGRGYQVSHDLLTQIELPLGKLSIRQWYEKKKYDYR